ncbi:hypothetical protein [Streptomyces sp. NPDC008121]|uniref:hypothetical protein n=1 Tax=Streptomyces sp. NPDC008121 TaxID=3364809 RepID=UPI0036EB3035
MRIRIPAVGVMMAAAAFLAATGAAPAAFADAPASGSTPAGTAAPAFSTPFHIVNNSSHDLQVAGNVHTKNNLGWDHAYEDGPAVQAEHVLSAHTTDTVDVWEMAGWNEFIADYRVLDMSGPGKMVEVDFFIQGMNLSFREIGSGPPVFDFDTSVPGTLVIMDAEA